MQTGHNASEDLKSSKATRTTKLNLVSEKGTVTLGRWTEYPDGWYGYPESQTWKATTANFYSKKEWRVQ